MEIFLFLLLIGMSLLCIYLLNLLCEEKGRSKDYLTEIRRLRNKMKQDQDDQLRIISDYERELQRTKSNRGRMV